MGTMPLSINHLGQLPSVTISFNLLPGFALSDAVTEIGEARASADIPQTVQGQFQGTAQAFQQTLASWAVFSLGTPAIGLSVKSLVPVLK